MSVTDNDQERSSTEDVPSSTNTPNSYGQILKSSSIIGGAQLINMGIGLVRMKLVAVLIGPSGIGLLGAFQSITALASILAGLGIQTSGVRDIAKYHESADRTGVSRTVTTLRRLSWFTGTAGMLLLMLLAPQVSALSFGSTGQTWAIIVLSVTVLIGTITGGQSAVIQGTRQIGDLARISIWNALFGTLSTVGMYSYFGVHGIVPSLVVMSMVTLVISSYYARSIELSKVKTSWRESWCQSSAMVRFGLATVASGVVGAVVSYLTRSLIIREFDLMAAGIFAAAFSLSGMFVQFVLGAMGADFYPRLTSVSNDHARMIRLINEQTEIGLLLAFPGLLFTLVVGPYALIFFYTKEFSSASDMLSWFILGCVGRVVSWPLGFSLLAKGKGGLFMVTEISFHLLHIGMIWVGIRMLGLIGVSVAFAILYLCYTFVVRLVANLTIGFVWSKTVCQLFAWMIPVALIVFLSASLLPQKIALLFGLLMNMAVGLQCLRQLALRLGNQHKLTGILSRVPGSSYLFRDLWQD